jgi:lysyl-tRNA synthetase class 2
MRWQPTAPIAMLELRARVLATIRAHFAEHTALEIETPTLSTAGTTDPALTSLSLQVRALNNARCYLHTSPELAMKRLVAAGSGDIYQICRVYRDGELGRWHEPEFSMLEWYRVGWDEQQLMDEVATLINRVLTMTRGPLPVQRLSYRDAFVEGAGVDPATSEAELVASLTRHDIALPADSSKSALLDLILSAIVVPKMPPDMIVFVDNYPADQAALARVDPVTGCAARFEAFIDGVELANGFAELADAEEQRQRFIADCDTRRSEGLDVPHLDEAFLEALTHGLPDCAGVAMGLDRLVAVAAGASEIAEVVSFAHRLTTA